MALKLIWRNIQRSGGDYLLLALTVTLLVAILCLANCIAVFGSIQAGFQTASLPVLIVIILFLLINTIHTFMLHQRAQALAVTLLLGMERRKLRRFYLGELCVIGIGCFLLGTLLGASLFSVVISPLLQIRTNTSWLSLMRKSILQTGGYFFLAELLSGMRIDRQLASLQISQLLAQKRRNHPIHRKNLRFWQRCFTISFVLFLIFLIGIAAAQVQDTSRSIGKTVFTGTGSPERTVCGIHHPVAHRQTHTVIGPLFQIDPYLLAEAGRGMVFCRAAHHRDLNAHAFDLGKGQTHLLEPVHPSLFKPADIVGMVDNGHLIRLIILHGMTIGYQHSLSFISVFLGAPAQAEIPRRPPVSPPFRR